MNAVPVNFFTGPGNEHICIALPSLICFRKMEWWEMEVVDKGSGHWDHPLVLLTHLTLLF